MGQKWRLLIFVMACLVGMAGFASADMSQWAEGLYVDGEVFSLQRSKEGKDLSKIGTAIVLASDDVDWDYDGGLSVSLGKVISDDLGKIELTGTSFGTWNAQKSVISAGEQLQPAFDIASDDEDWTDAYSHDIDYESRLWGFDVKHVLPLAVLSKDKMTTSWGYGFSSLNLFEKFSWHTMDESSNAPGANGNSYYRTQTRNRMLGGVLTLDSVYTLNDKIQIALGLKGGLYENEMYQTSSFEDDAVQSGYGTKKMDKLSGTIGTKLGVVWNMMKNTTLTAGYQFEYFENVALASEQISFGTQAAGTALNSRLSEMERGNFFVHGPFLKLSVKF